MFPETQDLFWEFYDVIPCIGMVQVLIATRFCLRIQSIRTRLSDWGANSCRVKRIGYTSLVPLASREVG